MKTVCFPKAQAAAILHRMDCGDCLAEVFADSDHLMHMADYVEDRARVLSAELTATGCVTIDPASDIDEALMIEAIEGSTWIAAFDRVEVSRQALAAARRTLQGAAFLIQTAFGLPDNSIEVPQV